MAARSVDGGSSTEPTIYVRKCIHLTTNDPYRLIASINLDRHGILVVGGGAVGERKVRTLLGAGASVTLVSPAATPALREMAGEGKIIWKERTATGDDFRGVSFALLTTPPEEAEALAPFARACGCLVDVCADGGLGDFALCAQFQGDGCYVGVSSGGGDPARAAATKRKLLRNDARPFVLISRGSPLATAQTGQWRDALEGAGVPVAIRTATTHGDRDRVRDLAAFGGFGVFVKALEEELLAGRADGAVHSLKDMPAAAPQGCALAAVLPRASACDVLVARESGVRGLEDLPRGAMVGTSSARRRAQVRSVRPDLECATCRGNVGTRLEKLARGEFDALILAEAGMERLGIAAANAVRLPFVAAAGQGAIALELSSALEGSRLMEAARALNHLPTWYETIAERELLRLMGLGCTCPVGVRGVWRDGAMELAVELYSIEPKENPADERVDLKISGQVSSEAEAKELAARLWTELCGLPLLRELPREAGGAPCR